MIKPLSSRLLSALIALVAFISVHSELGKAQTGAGQTPETASGPALKWGVTGAFDINMIGEWNAKEMAMTYGGGLGGSMLMTWPNNWSMNVDLMFCIDNNSMFIAQEIGNLKYSSFSVCLPVNAGYRFDVTYDMKMIVTAGAMLSQDLSVFSSHLRDGEGQESSRVGNVNHSFTLMPGLGINLVFDNVMIGPVGYMGINTSKVNVDGKNYRPGTKGKIMVVAKYFF